eukprot:g24920.t1
MQNLGKLAGTYQRHNLEAWHNDLLAEDCQNVSHPSTFTFVRNPLARFISGYAQLEHYHQEAMEHRKNFPPNPVLNLLTGKPGSVGRAKQFLDRFFVDGVLRDGHVRPQSEFFVKPYGSKCFLAVDFVGKTENVVEDWKRFLESQQCHVITQFNLTKGRHENSIGTKQALADAAEIGGASSFVELQSAAKESMEAQLFQGAYLRALCWLYLVDYVMFSYDLPRGCDHPHMLHIAHLANISVSDS